MSSKITAHLFVAEEVVHKPLSSDPPTVTTSRYSVELQSTEQPYYRTHVIEEEWKPLDYGWLKGLPIRQIYIHNRAGVQLQVIPTEEEQEYIAKQRLLIGILPQGAETPLPVLSLSPGETMRVQPLAESPLYLRSALGSIPITSFVIPE